MITVTGGVFLGMSDTFPFALWALTLVGISLVIAAGCVFNNVIDRDMDKHMLRTQSRVLVTGVLSPRIALVYGAVLGLLGLGLLAAFTNTLTAFIALTGLFFYVMLYSLWLKRRATWGLLVGGIAGAIPPVVGYTALTNRFDLGAVLLFVLLFFWQIPHFYAIALYRLEDYRSAQMPLLPLRKKPVYTQIHMLCYIAILTLLLLLTACFGYTGYLYAVVTASFTFIWFLYGLIMLKKQDQRIWAKKMFLFSIIDIMVLSLLMWIR